MQEKPQSKDGEARTTKQVHGTEQSPRGGWQASRSQVVHTGWKLSCQEVVAGSWQNSLSKDTLQR